jgi:hypothetical protein
MPFQKTKVLLFIIQQIFISLSQNNPRKQPIYTFTSKETDVYLAAQFGGCFFQQ